MSKMIKTYIIHFDKLKDRKEKMEKQLESIKSLNPVWFIQKGYYSEELIETFYEYDRKEWKRKARVAQRPIIPYPLTRSQKHLAVNHMLVRNLIAKGEEEYALVLEDDVKLEKDFVENLVRFIESNQWDIIYLDKGIKPNSFWTNGAYLIKKETARKVILLDELITLPNDEELQYRLKKLNLKVRFLPLVEQLGKPEDSGQSQRDKQGIKKYIYWRFYIYKKLPISFQEKIAKMEEGLKKKILGIK